MTAYTKIRRVPGRPLAAALLLLPLVLGACGTGEAEEPSRIQTVAVERGDLRITAEATGTIEPIRKVEVKSKAGGEILRLQADVGDAVEPGTLLASIDPRDVRNRYDQVVADLEVAEARAEIAQNQLERQQQLHESGVITAQELESARLEQSNANANLIKARTNVELAELQLGDVNIRAPMKGTIIVKSVEEGQVIQSASGNVSGGTTLFTMANLDEMQVRTLVDETDMGEIRAGMTAQVTVEAFPDRSFVGTVTKVEPQAVVQQNVTMFPVIVRLDNRGGLLRPGMNAEVEILIARASNVLLVPNGAIVETQDVSPAAMALGLDVNQLDLAEFRSAGRFAGGGRPGGARPGGDSPREGTAAPGSGGGRTAPGSGDGAGLRDSIQQKVEAGEISQDSARAIFRGRMAAAGGFPGAGGPPAGDPPAGDPADGAPDERRVRNAVVFVVDSTGTPAPRLVQVGLSDWDFTQVLGGIEEGQQLAVVGAAQLQAQQQEMMNRIRSRRGGGPF